MSSGGTSLVWYVTKSILNHSLSVFDPIYFCVCGEQSVPVRQNPSELTLSACFFSLCQRLSEISP